MINELFNQGIELGREHHTYILQRGSKWKSRNIPIYIRDHMLVPYYLIENDGNIELWIIKCPLEANDKVCFVCFTTVPYETTTIYVGTKSSSKKR